MKHVAFSPTGDSLLVIGGGMQARVYDRDGHKQYECVRGFTYISDPAQAKVLNAHLFLYFGDWLSIWRPACQRIVGIVCALLGSHALVDRRLLEPTQQAGIPNLFDRRVLKNSHSLRVHRGSIGLVLVLGSDESKCNPYSNQCAIVYYSIIIRGTCVLTWCAPADAPADVLQDCAHLGHVGRQEVQAVHEAALARGPQAGAHVGALGRRSRRRARRPHPRRLRRRQSPELGPSREPRQQRAPRPRGARRRLRRHRRHALARRVLRALSRQYARTPLCFGSYAQTLHYYRLQYLCVFHSGRHHETMGRAEIQGAHLCFRKSCEPLLWVRISSNLF